VSRWSSSRSWSCIALTIRATCCSQGGIVNTPLAIILPSLVSPFGIYLMRVYAADAIDDSLLEAARIDGAGDAHLLPDRLTPTVTRVVTVVLSPSSLPGTTTSSRHHAERSEPVPVTVASLNERPSVRGGAPRRCSRSSSRFVDLRPSLRCLSAPAAYWQSGLSAGPSRPSHDRVTT